MRLSVALLFVALAPILPAQAASSFTDPAKLIAALYAQYDPSHEFPDPDLTDALQSRRLNALYAADAKEADGEIGRIDFDPYVNGQDYEIKNLEIGAPYLAGGKAVVHVTFSNFDTPQDLGYLLVKEGGGWKIDDVWSGDKDYPYDLLDILQAPLVQ